MQIHRWPANKLLRLLRPKKRRQPAQQPQQKRQRLLRHLIRQHP